MGLYITDEDVKVRLIGKVSFTDNADDKNKMHVLLLKRLVREAEGQVEMDLSCRYEVPIQGSGGEPFSKLPASPTREFVRTMCELQAVIRVLETDFGRGTVVNGDSYSEKLTARYDKMKDQLTARYEEKNPQSRKTGWMYPPMRGLKLAYFNTESDDGYAGMVLVAGHGADMGFPREQINDPAQNWVNGTFHELDEETPPGGSRVR